MERPTSDYDTAKTGEALLEYAAEYRKIHPNAPLSEIADNWNKLKTLAYNGNGNGKSYESQSLG